MHTEGCRAAERLARLAGSLIIAAVGSGFFRPKKTKIRRKQIKGYG